MDTCSLQGSPFPQQLGSVPHTGNGVLIHNHPVKFTGIYNLYIECLHRLQQAKTVGADEFSHDFPQRGSAPSSLSTSRLTYLTRPMEALINLNCKRFDGNTSFIQINIRDTKFLRRCPIVYISRSIIIYNHLQIRNAR